MKAPIRTLIDYGPLLAFFAVFWLYGILPATGVLMAATLAALAVAYAMERRLAPMPLVTGVVVSVFGGLTLWLADETFIKMKPTIVNLVFAAVLLGGLALGKPPLRHLFGTLFQLDEAGWRALSWRWAVYFLAMAALNEAIWRTQTTEIWVSFKVFGILPLSFVFALAQMPLIKRHSGAPGSGS